MTKTQTPKTVAAFAKEIGISRQALYKHIAKGNLRIQKVGRYTVVSFEEEKRFKKNLHEIIVGGVKRVVFGK